MTVIIAGPTLAMWNDLDLVPARIYAAMAQRDMMRVLARSGMVLMSALGHALRRVLPCARMSGGLLGHRAYTAQVLCCSSLSVVVACVHSCVSGWGLTVSQMSWVGATGHGPWQCSGSAPLLAM